MMKKYVLILMALLPMAVFGQVRKVDGTYLYYGDPNMSLKEIRAAAIENARVQCIAKEFGTLLTQNTVQQENLKDGREHSDFLLLNASEVKGEWLEDLREPEILREELVDGLLLVEVRVSGRVRGISSEAVDFETLTLRNGTDKRFADTNFKDGDDLYVYFRAPADGFVAVYLVDEQQQAFCLLPYEGDADGQQPVEHNAEYVFFSPKHPGDVPSVLVDPLVMQCGDERFEHNQIYVLYSPTPFTKAADHQGALLDDGLRQPRKLTLKEFTRWMSRLCANDRQMARKVIHVTINKQ